MVTKALVETDPATPNQHKVRCGSLACRWRKFGKPLMRSYLLAVLEADGPMQTRLQCPRCRTYNDVELPLTSPVA